MMDKRKATSVLCHPGFGFREVEPGVAFVVPGDAHRPLMPFRINAGTAFFVPGRNTPS